MACGRIEDWIWRAMLSSRSSATRRRASPSMRRATTVPRQATSTVKPKGSRSGPDQRRSPRPRRLSASAVSDTARVPTRSVVSSREGGRPGRKSQAEQADEEGDRDDVVGNRRRVRAVEEGVRDGREDGKGEEAQADQGRATSPGGRDRAREQDERDGNRVGQGGGDVLGGSRGHVEDDSEGRGADQHPQAVEAGEPAQPEQRSRAAPRHGPDGEREETGGQKQESKAHVDRVGHEHPTDLGRAGLQQDRNDHH